MADEFCVSCRKLKVVAHCEACEGALCKSCVKHLDPETFSYLRVIPRELTHLRYCGACYDEKVGPALDSYNEIMDRAKQVFVFFKTQRKSIPITERSKVHFKIDNRTDRDDLILRLAFFAAELGFNALIEVEAVADKIRNGAYQTSKWRGEGMPARVDAVKLDRQDMLDHKYK
jgi:hypothetical protein